MRNRLKAVLIALAAVAAGTVVVWKLAPDRRPAEQQILDTLGEIQKAVAEKDLRGTMKHVSESYHDPTSENKRELTRLAIGGFREPGTFNIVLQVLGRPAVQGTTASVDVRVEFSVVTEQAARHAQPFTVRTRWAREKGGWKIVSADGYMDAGEAFEPGA